MSTTWSIGQWTCQRKNELVDHCIKKSINGAENGPTNQSIGQYINKSINGQIACQRISQ